MIQSLADTSGLHDLWLCYGVYAESGHTVWLPPCWQSLAEFPVHIHISPIILEQWTNHTTWWREGYVAQVGSTLLSRDAMKHLRALSRHRHRHWHLHNGLSAELHWESWDFWKLKTFQLTLGSRLEAYASHTGNFKHKAPIFNAV